MLSKRTSSCGVRRGRESCECKNGYIKKVKEGSPLGYVDIFIPILARRDREPLMNETGESPEKQKQSKRKGRPTHAEQLGRQRVNNFESIVDTFKRKREEEEDRIRIEKETSP